MAETNIRTAILGQKDSWHGRTLQTALQNAGIEPVFADVTQLTVRLGANPSVLCGEVELSDMDLVLVREVPGGTLEQVIYRMDALHQLENMGVRLVNPAGAIEKMVDKYYALSLMQTAGLPVPETGITENFSEAMTIYRRLGGDVVVKPLFGSRGVGMVRVTDEEIAGRVFKALSLGGSVFYIQKFVPHRNRDLRVLVSRGKCLAAMERVADGWKTNVSGGARPTAIEPGTDVIEASLKAAKVVGADYCGVDLLYDEDGKLYLLEVNSMPAWEGLQQVTGFNIADRLVDDFLDLVR